MHRRRDAPPFLPPQPHNQKWVGGGGEAAGGGGRAGETDNADGDGQAGGQAGGLMRGLDSGTGNQMMSYPNNYSPMPAPKKPIIIALVSALFALFLLTLASNKA